MKKNIIFILFICLSQNAFSDFMCETSDLYSGVYMPNEYICDVNQFLPANAVGCVDCPQGQTCPGGTYYFKPNKFQGLDLVSIPGTTNNICADNFPDRMIAIYEPNTLDLFWNDGTKTTQTQCTFNMPIEFPNDPVRPGYKFMGWRIKTIE